MKISLLSRRSVLAAACAYLLLAGLAVFPAPAFAQEETTEIVTEATTTSEQSADAAEVAEEKAENAAEQGEPVEPALDNAQARDVRPQDAQGEAEEVSAAAEASEPRIGMAKPKQIGMMPAASPVQERLIGFHNGMLILITVISVIVLLLLIFVCVRFSARANPVPSKTSHNVLIEVIWTLVPIILVVAILIPSFRHLYYMDHSEIAGEADVTIKVIGYQWYWNYEYPDHGFAFDSYIVKEEDLKEGQVRLLSTDTEVVVPVNKKVLLQITGGDVIHSWAMPSFGVKMDAVPGHRNETWFQATEIGLYYGQCSELCGVNHGFMPINVRVVSEEDYEKWLEEAKAKYASAPAVMQYAAVR